MKETILHAAILLRVVKERMDVLTRQRICMQVQFPANGRSVPDDILNGLCPLEDLLLFVREEQQ